MIRISLEKPVILAVGIIIVSLFGLAALFRVPLQLIPDLDPRVVTVQTVWPGASPQDVEKEILVEQEEFLRNVTGVDRMISTASFGRGTIELEFPFGMDINEALIRTSNALSQVPRYPENVDEPRITSDSFSQNSFAYYSIQPLPGNPKALDISREIDWVEDNIKTRLERVPGIASVEVSGGTRLQLNIYLDPARLASHRLNVMDVRNAVRSRNRDMSGGDMDFGKRRYLVRTLGRFQSVEEVNQLIVAERDGSFIRLSDVGYAEMGQSELRSVRFGNGNAQMFMSIRKQVGANIVEVFNGANAAIDELNAGIAGDYGVSIVLRSDDVRYIQDSVFTVIKNLLIGAVLAVLVLRLFLRSWSATLIGSVGIPVCALAAFLGLMLTGRTINVISMAGVAFAIGMTMDNSIVVLENIMRMVGAGTERKKAALEGVQEVWPAVLASTLTTIMVFLPHLGDDPDVDGRGRDPRTQCIGASPHAPGSARRSPRRTPGHDCPHGSPHRARPDGLDGVVARVDAPQRDRPAGDLANRDSDSSDPGSCSRVFARRGRGQNLRPDVRPARLQPGDHGGHLGPGRSAGDQPGRGRRQRLPLGQDRHSADRRPDRFRWPRLHDVREHAPGTRGHPAAAGSPDAAFPGRARHAQLRLARFDIQRQPGRQPQHQCRTFRA
jgi:hypothetical protein